MKVLVYPADTGGCGYYRLLFAATHLKSLGHDIQIEWPGKETGFEVYLEDEAPIDFKLPYEDVDVIVMQRISHVWHTTVVPLMQSKGIAVVVDMDDDLSNIHRDNAAYWNYHPRNIRTPFSWKYTEQVCRSAAMVTVSTKSLLKKYAGHGRGAVIDNYIPEHYLDIVPVREHEPVFGWAGTVQSHPADLQVCGPAVRTLINQGHRFKIIGPGHKVKEYLRLEQEPEATGVVLLANWASAVAQLDVGMVPLEPSAFNTSKCFDASHRILTSGGVLLANELEPGHKVWRHGLWHEVEEVAVDEPRLGLKITTESGYTLRLTKEHRMFVNGNWVQAASISINDIIIMEPEMAPEVEYQYVPWPADSRMSRNGFDPKAFVNATNGPRLCISEEWGLVLGALIGDGSAGGSVGASTRLDFSCDGQDQDWIDILKEALTSAGLFATQTNKFMFDGTPLRRQTVSVSSAHLLRVLESMGLVISKDPTAPKTSRMIRNPCVPDVIWKSPKSVIAAFISGYFEADGTVVGTSIAVTSKSEQLIKDIQRLLLLFGIKSRVNAIWNAAQTGPKRQYWKCTLNRDAADVFEKFINFQSQRKRKKLAEVTVKPHSNAFRPMRWEEKVQSIEDCILVPVDIQVENEEFILEGFVSHNSRLKGLEYNATGVPYVASSREEYRKFHRESGAGFLVDTPKDWTKAIGELMTNEALRKELAERGRAFAETQTIEQNSWRWWEAWTQAHENLKAGKV